MFLSKNCDQINTRLVSSLIFGSQLFGIPFLIIVFNLNVYNGIRHILFIFPPLAFFGSYLIHFLEEKSIGLRIKKIMNFIFIILIITNILDIFCLSPYQYTYINEFNRDRHLSGLTDLDYWGASVGELYKKSKNKSNSFPYTKMTSKFLKLNQISIEKTEDNFDRFIDYGRHSSKIKRSIEQQYIISEDCKIISVIRNYPITNQSVKLSSLYTCKKKNN